MPHIISDIRNFINIFGQIHLVQLGLESGSLKSPYFNVPLKHLFVDQFLCIFSRGVSWYFVSAPFPYLLWLLSKSVVYRILHITLCSLMVSSRRLLHSFLCPNCLGPIFLFYGEVLWRTVAVSQLIMDSVVYFLIMCILLVK